MKKQNKNRDPIHLVTGCFFLGIGTGFLTGHIIAGTFIGFGIGFALKYWIENKK